MASPVEINQVTQGLERLITLWKDKPNVVGLLESYLESIQELEEVYFQLLEERGLDSAIGVQLDNLGLIVGEPREGRTDDDYRTAIKLRIAINTSDGTEPRVSDLIKQLSGAETIIFEDVYPAGVKITAELEDTTIDANLLNEIKNILAATITAELSFVTFLPPPFVFEGDDSGEGFSDTGFPDEGGFFAENINLEI